MKHWIAVAENVISLTVSARIEYVRYSDSFLRNNVVVVIAAAIFLGLGDLVLRASGTFKLLACGLPVQLLALIQVLRRI